MTLFLGITSILFGLWATLATYRAWQFHGLMTQSMTLINVAILINNDLIQKNKMQAEALSAVHSQRVH